MTDQEYRDLLSRYKVESSKDLSNRDFVSIMKDFKALGFVHDKKYRKPPDSKKLLMAKLFALRKDLGLPEAYLDSMARQMFRVDSYRWISADQAHKMVAALSIHKKRKEAK
jgi:hypothetical protein